LLYLFIYRNTPQWVGATSYSSLHDHTTLGVAPLDDWISLSKELYLTKLNIHKRHTPWPGGIWTNYPSKRATADWHSTVWGMSLSWGGESWTRTNLNMLACDLYHNNHHFYYTIPSHISNCCGPFELIWSVSCFSPNISHRSFLLTISCAASF